MTVRPYLPKDKDDVRYICLNSEGECKLSKRGRHFILTTYCDYYIEKESENCFVAVDENDKAIGYIICTENFDNFKKIFTNEYIQRFRKCEFLRRKHALKSFVPQENNSKDYPAHLHIDILPEYQRMGLGHKLTDALCEHLKNKGVKGVMLTTWVGNKAARGFYEKYGFTLIKDYKNCVAYGIKF